MKTSSIVVFLCLFIFSCTAQTECNYVDPVYSTWVEEDVLIGETELFDGTVENLFMDIYKPIGDQNEARPLMIWYYGGGFSGGSKEDMADLCNLYAARGYVAVAANYRLGFQTPLLLTYPYAYDTSELIRANYRAMQDAKGTIRYLKSRAAIDSSDVNNFFAGGFSAGGFTALAAAFWDEPGEKPLDCGEIDPANNNIPASPRPDLGDIDGPLHLGLGDATLKGVVNLFGGVIDSSIITDNNGPAVYFYHQTDDPIVPCQYMRPYSGIGLGVPAGYPMIHGSCNLYQQLSDYGYPPERLTFYEHPGNAHAIHDPILIDLETATFLENLICNVVSTMDLEPFYSLDIYPNPFSESFQISFSEPIENDALLSLYDIEGQLIWQQSLEGGSNDQPLEIREDMHSGLYYLLLQTGSDQYVEKIIKH